MVVKRFIKKVVPPSQALRIALALLVCLAPLPASHGRGEASEPNTQAPLELYVCALTGNDANPGTLQMPLKTIQKASDLARPGTTVKLLPGEYVEQVLVSNGGTRERPIVFESTQWRDAVMTDRACCFKQVGGAAYITIRGIWFRDCPLADGGLFAAQVIVPARGWRLEDCRFTRCGAGLGYDRRAADTSETAVVRCVFEDMDATASWAWAAKGQRMEGHLLKDTIFRRINGINNDPAWQGQGAKYGYTKDLVVDGLISYDNNGPGLWLDWNNDGFLVQNSTFFCNHAGWAYANFTDQRLGDKWWIGDGIVSECNGSGVIRDNTIYGNLGAGIAVWESGHLGGILVTGNTLVENGINLELRAMVREDFGDPAWLQNVTVSGNRFKGWKYACWMTASLVDTIRDQALPAQAGCSFEGNTYKITGSSVNGLYGKWLTQWTQSILQMQELLGVEQSGLEADFAFEAAIPAVRGTELADVGTPAMWQVPSQAAEENDFERAMGHAGPGDRVTLPVTGRKAAAQENGVLSMVIYDLQMRQVALTLSQDQLDWAEANIRPYASMDQVDVPVVLTSVEPYRIEAVLAGI